MLALYRCGKSVKNGDERSIKNESKSHGYLLVAKKDARDCRGLKDVPNGVFESARA